MKHIETILASFALILCFGAMTDVHGQAGYTLYNMHDVPQSAYLNPAIDPGGKFHIGLPLLSSLYGGFENNAFPYSQAITDDEDGNPVLDMNYLADNLKPRNYFTLDLGVDLFNFGFRHRKNYFYFSARELIHTEFVYPENFVKLIVHGNAPYIGRRLSLDHFAYHFTSYREYALGWSHAPDDKWQLGGRFKFLAGMENIRTVSSSLGITTDPDNYHLTIDGSFDVRTSGVNALLNTEFKLQERLLNVQNPGVGIDLGARYRYNDKWSFSASVTDLGFIRWRRDISNYSMNDTSFTFRGVNLNDLITEGEKTVFERLTDSLENTFVIKENDENYSSYLRARLFLQAEYRLTERHGFSALAHATFVDELFNPALSLAWNAQFGRILGTTLSYNAYGRNFTNIGLGITLMLGPFQMYAVTDNVFGFTGTSYSKNRHIRVGLNLMFGRGKKKKSAESADEES